MSSVPYITPADPLPQTAPVVQSTLNQVPLVQTQILPPTGSMVPPQTNYVPVSAQARQGKVSTGVKVVAIYD